MSNLKINSINKYSAINHYSTGKNFKSDGEISRKYTDEELLQMASYVPNKKLLDVHKNVLKSLLIAVPALDITTRMIAKNGNLSSKVKSAAIVSAFWTTAIATGISVGKVKKDVNNNSKFLDDFNKEHPVASTLVDFAVAYSMFIGALKGVGKIVDTAKQKLPNQVEALKNKVVTPLKSLLNNSIINKKLVLPFENYLEKNPVVSKSVRKTALLAVPTVVFATLLRFLAEAKKRNENIENNYFILKTMNDNYSKQMDDSKEVE